MHLHIYLGFATNVGTGLVPVRVDSIHWQFLRTLSSKLAFAYTNNGLLSPDPSQGVASSHWQDKRNVTGSELTIAFAGDDNLVLVPGTTRWIASTGNYNERYHQNSHLIKQTMVCLVQIPLRGWLAAIGRTNATLPAVS